MLLRQYTIAHSVANAFKRRGVAIVAAPLNFLFVIFTGCIMRDYGKIMRSMKGG